MSQPSTTNREEGVVTASPSRGRQARRWDWLLPVGFMTPAVLIGIGIVFFCMILLIALSLREQKLGTLEALLNSPMSLENYVEIITDPATWRSLWISVIYTVGTTIVPFGIGLAFALLLNEQMPGRRVLRTLALVPWAIPGVTATIAFMWIMQPTYGVANYLLRVLGISDADVDWFGNVNTALIAVMIPTIWKGVPFFLLMLLAGLQSINGELYEAAEVDGAGRWAKFRYVTIPSLAPFIFVSLVFGAMHSFREFDFIYASTGGGPQGATETIAVRIFNLAFDRFDFTGAAALGVFTFVLVSIVIVLLVRRDRKGALEGFL